MTDRERQRISEMLREFPEVSWDRTAEQGGSVCVWGWLPAGSGVSDHDFVLLLFTANRDRLGLEVQAATSADHMWDEISRRLFGIDVVEIDLADPARVFDLQPAKAVA